MKKILISILLLFCLTLSSCSEIQNNQIQIGFANSLDYSFGNLGVDSMYGARLAVKEINESGGVNGKSLSLIIKDDDRNPNTAVTVDNSLAEEGIVAIIGHGFSNTAEAIINNANTNEILLISPTISTTFATGKDDLFIRVTPSTLEQGYSLANAMHLNSPGDVLICYESENAPFTIDFKNAFVEKYTELGHSVNNDDIHTFEINDLTDYQLIADEINTSGISNILTIGSAFDVSNIVQRIETPNNFNFYFPAWTETSDFLELAGPNIENSISINFYDFSSNNVSFINFKQNYLSEYGRSYSYASLLAYESVFLLKQALESTNDWSAQSLKEQIISNTTYSGIMNDYYMNQYGDVQRKIYHYRIIDGEFVTIGSDNYV